MNKIMITLSISLLISFLGGIALLMLNGLGFSDALVSMFTVGFSQINVKLSKLVVYIYLVLNLIFALSFYLMIFCTFIYGVVRIAKLAWNSAQGNKAKNYLTNK